MHTDRPPGLLRLLVVFHESEALGAGRSLLGALSQLPAYGWSAIGWFPGEGPLVEEAEAALTASELRARPIAYSSRGWRASPGPRARLRDTPNYLRSFRKAVLRFRPHVVHVNTLRALPEASVARSLGLPVVLHVHELPEPSSKRTLALTWGAAVSDVVVGVSDAVAELVRAQAPGASVITVHNGIAPLAPGRRQARAGTIGTVGTVSRTKGTDLFLEAASLALDRLPELRFEHVGQTGLDHDGEFGERVADLASSDALAGSVAMLGRQPATEASRHWELFVLPSRQDAFPLATLEAMASGLPVVAAGVGGVPEQIVHLESGVLVPPEDPRAIAEWIIRLHENEGLRERLAANGAQRVRQRFDVERQARGLHRAYLAALNLKHGPPRVRRATQEAL